MTSHRLRPRLLVLATAGLLGLPLLSACTDNTAQGDVSGDPRRLTVTATDTECQVSAAEAPSGHLTFSVTNDGSKGTSRPTWTAPGSGSKVCGRC